MHCGLPHAEGPPRREHSQGDSARHRLHLPFGCQRASQTRGNLLADGLVINFFAKHEKGVKTEFIDPIVTMQVLSLVKLSTNAVTPGLHKMDTQLRLEDMRAFWNVVNENCRPLTLHD